MSDQTISEAVQEGVERALEHADPAARLRAAQAGMTDRIKATAQAQRRGKNEPDMRPRWHRRWPDPLLRLNVPRE